MTYEKVTLARKKNTIKILAKLYESATSHSMLYKGLKGAASIPTNDLVPPITRTRNHHSLAFQIPMAGTDIYKSSFFPQTIRDWNLLTDSLISTSECAVDSVTKFTSLVRARD